MKTTLLYGNDGLHITLPERAQVIEPRDENGIENELQMVKNSLQNPIGCPSIIDLAKSTDKVAIVISDITRPTPNHILVPALIQTLSHIPFENFIIINGTGTHREQTREEFIQMLGNWVVEHIPIINHRCNDMETLKKVGTSKFGCDVYLNKEYVEADFKIVTGFIEPHFFAGFSGGPKGIMPGIAGMETIQTFHNAQMIGDPRSTWANMEDNPLQEMTREINYMCQPDFMLNVTLNRQQEITAVFAGELFEAHEKGCAHVKEHAMVRCKERFDVVITSNAGYPLDQNLYQAVKGMSTAHQIVKKNGAIIIAAQCSDGLPDHGNFSDIFTMANSPEELLDMINHPDFAMVDQWQVQKLAVIQNDAHIYLYSTLRDELVEQAFINVSQNIELTINSLEKKYGDQISIAVLPLGPLTIPYIDS